MLPGAVGGVFLFAGVFLYGVAAAGVGVGYGAVLHQYQLVLAAAARVGAEYAVVAVLQSGLHAAPGHLRGEHVVVGLQAGRAFYPAKRLYGHAAAEIAAGGLQAEDGEVSRKFQGGGHFFFYPEKYLKRGSRGRGLGCRRGRKAGFKVAGGLFVGKVHVAALQAPGHKGAVGVLYYGVQPELCGGGVFFGQGFPAVDGFIAAGARPGHGYYPAAAHYQVRAYYYAHVIQLQALGGVDAAHFTYGSRLDYPGLAVRGKVPGGLVAGQHNIFKGGRFLA